MASESEFENIDLDEEVKELLENYKYKRATLYEPCTIKNFKECLIGISEELGLLNIKYTFNPHLDVERETLTTEALVRVINSVWILLQNHKNIREKAETLAERNHILESCNKQLNGVVRGLKEKINIEKNESKACVASAQRVSDQSSEIYQKLLETRSKLTQLTKQKETNEKSLQNKITKLQLENNKLMDKLRNKSGSYSPCSEVCDASITLIKDREKKQRKIIATLQANNHDLLREVLTLKEDLILEGLQDINIDNKNRK
ncbi:centrosomin-like [Battus philenor]|uniref:centrosomin-like n=1 Tax=Battus philenor TaxID=42288 RepID=UPI0035D08576